MFPASHQFDDKDLKREKVFRHTEPTIDLSEMETSNMVTILERISMRYLELLAERLYGSEKEKYQEAVFKMRSGAVSEEELKEAENFFMNAVDQFGIAENSYNFPFLKLKD